MSDTLSLPLDTCSVQPNKISSVEWQLGTIPLIARSPLHDQVTHSNETVLRL